MLGNSMLLTPPGKKEIRIEGRMPLNLIQRTIISEEPSPALDNEILEAPNVVKKLREEEDYDKQD